LMSDSKKEKADPPVLWRVENSVAIICFNRPKKLNAWSPDLTTEMLHLLKRAGDDSSVLAAIITGTGRYYSAGVDFSGSMGKPVWPSTLVAESRKANEALFDAFITFPKPLFAAINGPAVGAAVTSACSLCDAVICLENASFHTPFVTLGITAEGCSSFTFPRISADCARVMLDEGLKVDASTALRLGLVQEVLAPGATEADLVTRALGLARSWVDQGRKRRSQEEGLVSKLQEVNAAESKLLSESFVQRPFLEAQYKFAVAKKKTAAAWVFWVFF